MSTIKSHFYKSKIHVQIRSGLQTNKNSLHKKSLAAADVEYPAYGVTGPNKDISPSGDRRLAQSAQMYHYQHQKNLIIATENRAQNEHRNGSLTDAESDEENEEGDYTVYECPGLAPVSVFSYAWFTIY